jgi:hypothetical protein
MRDGEYVSRGEANIRDAATGWVAHERGLRTSRMGRSSVTITCPCCGTHCKAYVWSLAGSGKRCPNEACQALHGSYGTLPNKMLPGGAPAPDRNKTGVKALDRVAADPRVAEVRREGGDGYWVDLVPGQNLDGCSSFRGESAREVAQLLKLVRAGDPY